MQSVIESLKSLKESDFFKNVNLHIHTNLSDGTLTPQEVIECAKKENLKIISITDHNTVEAYKYISSDSLDGLELITGVEFDCWYRTDLLHILGYGIDVNHPEIKKICAKNLKGTRLDFVRFFNSRRAGKVITSIKEAGGVAVLAHPACCWSFNLERMIRNLKDMGLDGIEVYYPYVGYRKIVRFYPEKAVKNLAQELNLLLTGGTDCHSTNINGR